MMRSSSILEEIEQRVSGVLASFEAETRMAQLGYWAPRMGAWRRALPRGDVERSAGYPDFMFWILDGEVSRPRYAPPCSDAHQMTAQGWAQFRYGNVTEGYTWRV